MPHDSKKPLSSKESLNVVPCVLLQLQLACQMSVLKHTITQGWLYFRLNALCMLFRTLSAVFRLCLDFLVRLIDSVGGFLRHRALQLRDFVMVEWLGGSAGFGIFGLDQMGFVRAGDDQ